MTPMDKAKELSSRGMHEQIDWILSREAQVFYDSWLTLFAEYDSVEAQAKGDRTELHRG